MTNNKSNGRNVQETLDIINGSRYVAIPFFIVVGVILATAQDGFHRLPLWYQSWGAGAASAVAAVGAVYFLVFRGLWNDAVNLLFAIIIAFFVLSGLHIISGSLGDGVSPGTGLDRLSEEPILANILAIMLTIITLLPAAHVATREWRRKSTSRGAKR